MAGRSLHELGLRFVRPDRAFLRLLFEAGLHDHHRADGATVRRLVRRLGVRRAAALVGEALLAAFPDPAKPAVDAARAGEPEGWDWLRLLKVWCECGGDAAVFWRQTPRLLQLYFDGRAAAAELDFKHRAWLAWHIAGLPHSRQMKGTFEAFLETLGLAAKAEPRRQSPEEQLAIAKAWTARLGGMIH